MERQCLGPLHVSVRGCMHGSSDVIVLVGSGAARAMMCVPWIRRQVHALCETPGTESAEPREDRALWAIRPSSSTSVRAATASSAQRTQQQQQNTHTVGTAAVDVKRRDVPHTGQDLTNVLNGGGLEFAASISRSWHPFVDFVTFPLIHFLNAGVNCSSKSMWEQERRRHLPGALFKVSDTLDIRGHTNTSS